MWEKIHDRHHTIMVSLVRRPCLLWESLLDNAYSSTAIPRALPVPQDSGLKNKNRRETISCEDFGMALKYLLEHSSWHKVYAATWRKSCGQQVKQSLILNECQRFSPSSPAIPRSINNTKTWTPQALSCIELQKI